MIIPAELGVTALILCFISNPIMCLTETVQKMSLMTPSGGALCTEHIKNGHVRRAKREKRKKLLINPVDWIQSRPMHMRQINKIIRQERRKGE